MKKILLGALVLTVLVLSGCAASEPAEVTTNVSANTTLYSGPLRELGQPADKIEVMHFHSNRQCWSCVTIGEYTEGVIKENFAAESAAGTIVYHDINVDLPENKEIAAKYQARGSALFFNVIISGQDNIEEDITVWRLLNSEQRFETYMEDKIRSLLGK